MSVVGTVVRAPGIVDLAILATTVISRGQAVSWDNANKIARIAQTTDKVYGIATSDGDTDTLRVPVAIRGGYTVAVKALTGITFATADTVYYDAAGQSGNFTNVAGTGQGAIAIGWIVDSRVDAQGNLEMAYFTI